MPDQPFVTSLDIINLSHSLKDICEVNCKTPECFSHTLKMLLQYNLIKLNLIFSQQLDSQMPPLCSPPCRSTAGTGQPDCKKTDAIGQPGRQTASRGDHQESETLNDLGLLNLEAISTPERLGLEELSLLDQNDNQKQK